MKRLVAIVIVSAQETGTRRPEIDLKRNPKLLYHVALSFKEMYQFWLFGERLRKKETLLTLLLMTEGKNLFMVNEVVTEIINYCYSAH